MAPLPDDRFDEVFRTQYPRLVALARRVLGDADEAQDAAQEALLRLRTDPVASAGDAGVRVDEPADAVVGADERERVRTSLAVLPERQATALLLRHAGHSYREIATALGVAEGSVGVLLARGERAFRRAHEEMTR